MRWSEQAPAAIIATVLAVAAGCGARTGFLTDESGDDGGTPGLGTRAGSAEGAGGAGSGICTFHHGPVASCESAPGDLAMPCSQVCLNIDGQWGCCSSNGPNDGAHGVCTFLDFWRCSPDGGLTLALP